MKERLLQVRVSEDEVEALDLFAGEAKKRGWMVQIAIESLLKGAMDGDLERPIKLQREVVCSGVDPLVKTAKLFVKWKRAKNNEEGYEFRLLDWGEKRKFWMVVGPEDAPAMISTVEAEIFNYVKNLERHGILGD